MHGEGLSDGRPPTFGGISDCLQGVLPRASNWTLDADHQLSTIIWDLGFRLAPEGKNGISVKE
jgi:hypothetical protein